MEFIIALDFRVTITNAAVVANKAFQIFDDPATRIGLASLRLNVREDGTGTDVSIGVAVTDTGPAAALYRMNQYLVNSDLNPIDIGNVSITNSKYAVFTI